MQRKTVSLFKAAFLLLLALAAWISFNLYPIFRDYLFDPPVAFRENAAVALGLYPSGRPSAAVFTNDDACSFTDPGAIDRLGEALRRLGVRGTFFVVPAQFAAPSFRKDSPAFLALERLAADGHEIAQHGYSHCCERSESAGEESGMEMALLSEKKQEERIGAGREILRGLGFPPLGHRSPCFSGNEATFVALDRLGFLYGSDLDLPAATLWTILTPSFRGGVVYPYHPRGFPLLQVTCQADPTVRPEKAREVFSRFHRRGGAFVFLTHLPQVAEEENLKKLEEFLRALQESGAWLCRLDELCSWWRARETVRIETSRAGDLLEIVCDNPSPFPLPQAVFVVKEAGSTRYRLRMKSGEVIAEGKIPEGKRIEMTIPGLSSH
jgi:peptidoglycan/xylan/chitin deacetylase (PgdA/CDA1 family)